jgi:uncharacterized repeat protein (TIGR01451 family)
VRVTAGGELEVTTPVGGFGDERPYAYQEADGRRAEVAATYDLADTAEAGARVYGFRLGPYDASQLLVLDPVMLIYAGYIGGAGDDQGNCIAVDTAGNAYVAGFTTSSEATFPETVGPDLTYNGGVTDAFVAKVNAAGTGLLYAGYIGGSGQDNGNDIVVDGLGNAYVVGLTASTQASFPVLIGPDLTYNGAFDGFVAKVAEVVPTATFTPTPTNTPVPPTDTPTPTNTSVPPTNTPTPTPIPVAADLSVTKVDAPDPVTAGRILFYGVRVRNRGPNTATGVTLTDVLPPGVTFVGATSTQGSCVHVSGTVTCSLGTLASGASAGVAITVRPQAPGTITNSATAVASQPDPNPANNTATAMTTVRPTGEDDDDDDGDD